MTDSTASQPPESGHQEPDGLEDDVLARRAAYGCAASFDCLMRRHQARVLHFLRRRAGTDDGEDLLQETFVRAFQGLRRYDPRWRFITWLLTIARRVAMNHARRPRAETDSEAIESAVAREPEPERRADADEQRCRLWDVASRVLSEEERTALWLVYVEELSGREVAAVLQRSWGSTKMMIWRARRKLRPWIEPENGGSREPPDDLAGSGADGAGVADGPAPWGDQREIGGNHGNRRGATGKPAHAEREVAR